MKASTKSTTYDREMLGAGFRQKFEESYRQLLLSELVFALMEADQVSVRALAKEVGISPSVIQDIRSGNRTNITLKTFLGILSVLGCEVAVKKNGETFVIGEAA